MKSLKKLPHSVLMASVALLMPSLAQSSVVTGDVLRFDFNDNGTATGWNATYSGLSNSQTQLVTLVSNAIRFNDGASTGVSLSITANGGNGIYGESTTAYNVTTNTGWDIAATGDIVYFNNVGSSNALVFSLSGLDDSLTYTINIFGGVGGTTTRPTNNWSAGGSTVSFNPKDNVDYVSLTSVSSTGSTIDLSAYTSSTGAGIINAIEVIVSSSNVPEPASSALLFALTSLAGTIALRRKRR